jgi:hypothetical protein
MAFGLILVALWSRQPVRGVVGSLTFIWIVVSTLQSGPSADALGFRPAEWCRSWLIVCAALASAAFVIWIASRMGTLHLVFGGVSVATSSMAYMIWALAQQFIMQDFFLLRLLRLLPTRTSAVIVAASLFAIAHIPNPLLMVVTLVWGIAACALFLRYRDLYSLGLAHGILGLCLAIAIPNAVHHQMRVGAGYFRWHAPAPAVHRSQADHIASTEAWVMADATSRRSSRQALP